MLAGRVDDVSELSREELQFLRQALEGKREELNGLIGELAAVTGTKHDCAILVMADSASLYEMQRRAAALTTQHQRTLAEIDAALARMDAGTYGLSVTTGEPIPLERLRLIPWARSGVDD